MNLKPNQHFDWGRVLWDPPDEPSEGNCSYCSARISEDAVPLRLWNEEGWGAQFCDTCETEYWNLRRIENACD